MMIFLALAAKAKWPVKTYRDHASATWGNNNKRQLSVEALELQPVVTCDEEFGVGNEKLAQM